MSDFIEANFLFKSLISVIVASLRGFDPFSWDVLVVVVILSIALQMFLKIGDGFNWPFAKLSIFALIYVIFSLIGLLLLASTPEFSNVDALSDIVLMLFLN